MYTERLGQAYLRLALNLVTPRSQDPVVSASFIVATVKVWAQAEFNFLFSCLLNGIDVEAAIMWQ